MICGCTPRMWAQIGIPSLIRPRECRPALRKWHERRSVRRCGQAMAGCGESCGRPAVAHGIRVLLAAGLVNRIGIEYLSGLPPRQSLVGIDGNGR